MTVRSTKKVSRLRDIRKKLHLHQADLSSASQTQRLLKKICPDILFHLAAATNVARDTRLVRKMTQANVQSTRHLLRYVDTSVKKIVIAGTCEEYGTNRAPFAETLREIPVSPYSASKIRSTRLALDVYRRKKLPITVARPFLTYGPGQDNDMFIPSLIRACLRGTDYDMTPGEQTREFNYVDDIVEGLIAVALSPKTNGEILNIGNSREIRLRDVARKIKTMTKAKIKIHFGAKPYRSGEVMHFYSDTSKIRRLTNWRPRVSFQEGLKRTIHWFKYDR